MDAVCIKGAADFSWDGYSGTCDKLDSFYVVSNMKVHITAKEDCISTLQVLLMKDMENHFP
mgnify:CR=1 FL=1